MNISSLPPILHPLSDFMDYIFLVNILDEFIHDFILIRSKRLSIISYNISKITCELWFCVEPLHHFMPFFLFKIMFNGCIDNIFLLYFWLRMKMIYNKQIQIHSVITLTF